VLESGISPLHIMCRPPGSACMGPPMTFVAHARGTAQIVAHRDNNWTDVRVTIVVD
jgi:hypothetical protein